MKVSSKHLVLGGAVAFMIITALMVHAVTASIQTSIRSTSEKVQITYTFIDANRAARYLSGTEVDAEKWGFSPDSLKKLSESATNIELKKRIPPTNKEYLAKIERAERVAATVPLNNARNPDVIDWLLELQLKAFVDLFTTDAKYGFPSAPAGLLFKPIWIIGFLAAMASCFTIGWGFGMRRRESNTAGA